MMDRAQALLALGARDFDIIGARVDEAMRRKTTMTVFDEAGEAVGVEEVSVYTTAVARLNTVSSIVRSDLVYQWQCVNTKLRDEGGSRLGADAVKRALTAMAFSDQLDTATTAAILAPVDGFIPA